MGQRIGILGGTFDPIHFGHLNAASKVASRLELDQVLFIPAGQPWRKQTVHANAQHRLAMVSLAIEGDDRFAVSRIDIDREGPTYTIDTLRELRSMEQYATADLFFITGADAIAEIDTWKDHEQLAELAQFVAVARPGFDDATGYDDGTGDVAIRLDVPAVDVSSTSLRKRVRGGESIDDLTAFAVIGYIQDHELYSNPEAPTGTR